MNLQSFNQTQACQAADVIRSRTSREPRTGLVLGSGLNALAGQLANADHIPYTELPYFARSTVEGHVGRLVFGELAGQSVVIMQGRFHAYEGWPLQQVTFPIRVMHELGVHTLVVTNAAGGLNPEYRVGDLMLIIDHIALAGMTGMNPLIGPNEEGWGPRFPDMTRAYDPDLRRVTLEVAAHLGLVLREGIYCGLSGPSFETPAEVRFLRAIGADAVGMSTVPEVIVARHMNMRVLGISAISNAAIADPDSDAQVNHEEVLQAGQTVGPKLMALIPGVLAEMPTLEG